MGVVVFHIVAVNCCDINAADVLDAKQESTGPPSFFSISLYFNSGSHVTLHSYLLIMATSLQYNLSLSQDG